jgi:anti-sigma factor RsiW
MLTNERVVAGLSCSEVLADLSRMIDGELPEAEASRLRAHVAGCGVCERFGRRFSTVVRDLREAFGEPEPLEAGVAERLRARIAAP